ncbi:MAG: hypothetical protein ACAH95_05600 [Fimbriimonas sp.]
MPGVFGRTNQSFPAVWLRLEVPLVSSEIDSLAEAAVASGLPLDLSTMPALWGGKMRGSGGVLSCVSSADYERANDSGHAGNLVQAHLIESLSCIGREFWDFYFLRFRGSVSESILSGVFEALEMAKQEGHIRFVGLCSEGSASATLSMWSLHDAFDAILIPRAEDVGVLGGMARQRRVGVLAPSGGDIELRSVRKADEVPG